MNFDHDESRVRVHGRPVTNRVGAIAAGIFETCLDGVFTTPAHADLVFFCRTFPSFLGAGCGCCFGVVDVAAGDETEACNEDAD